MLRFAQDCNYSARGSDGTAMLQRSLLEGETEALLEIGEVGESSNLISRTSESERWEIIIRRTRIRVK